MPTESQYPSFEVPDLGLWDFLFERKDREFPDDKGGKKLFFVPQPKRVI